MDIIVDYLQQYNLSAKMVTYLSNTIMILIISFICIAANFVAKKVILTLVIRIVKSNKYSWDDVLLEHKVFHKLSHIFPALIIYYSSASFTHNVATIEKIAFSYIVIVGLSIVNASLNAFEAIYRTYPIAKVRPIKGYISVVKIIVYIFAGITVIANFIGQNPVYILSGLGALSAIILLIFKDSILGLVAGIQLSANDMVRVGDWIEMPRFNANGDIIDITLNTVKVMNFDKSISMIPSYTLISDSFRNWRGMQDAGGRRIKRAVHIDINSIRFCDEELIAHLKKVHLLSDYLTSRLQEIDTYNKEHHIDKSIEVNGRQLTNIGVFRVYMEHYLRQHPQIHQDFPLMVRQLDSGDSGLPIEIYAFSKSTVWVVFEGIQSDIFDHIFAVAPSFQLRIFQQPSGHDLSKRSGYGELG